FATWFDKKQYKKQPILRIGGVSGSGKTELIKYIFDLYKFDERSCWVVSYTGQAVNVLRRRGIHARTIHSSFMYAKDEQLYGKDGKPLIKNGIPVVGTKFVP